MTFTIDTDEQEKIDAWLSEHDKGCKLAKYSGAIGGSLTYSFTQTSLGVIVRIKCACGKEFDPTDYLSW